MVPKNLSKHEKLGYGLVVLGLCFILVVGAGVYSLNQKKFDYTIEEDVEIHAFSDLSENERELFQDALNVSEEETYQDPDDRDYEATGPGPVRFDGPGYNSLTQYVLYEEDEVYTVWRNEEEAQNTENLSIGMRREEENVTVHEYSNLSETAKKAVRKTTASPGSTVTIDGALAPEFDTNGPDYYFDHGKYIIRYNGELSVLFVSSGGQSGLGQALLAVLFVILGIVGVVSIVTGGLIAYTESLRPGAAILAGIVTFVALPTYLNTKIIGTSLGSLGVLVAVWALLYWNTVRR